MLRCSQRSCVLIALILSPALAASQLTPRLVSDQPTTALTSVKSAATGVTERPALASEQNAPVRQKATVPSAPREIKAAEDSDRPPLASDFPAK